MIFFYAALFVGALAQPLVIVLALGTAALSRKWWQALTGGIVAGVAEFLFDATGDLLLLAMCVAAGIFWSLFLFGVIRALRK